MDYRKHYENLVNTRKSLHRNRSDEEQYECHHITPRSMGGDNKNSNLVLLTPREHLLAHWLLWRIHQNAVMARAFFAMCKFRNRSRKKCRISGRAYQEARLAYLEKRRPSIVASNKKRKGGTHRGKYAVTVKKDTTILLENVQIVRAFELLTSMGIPQKGLWNAVKDNKLEGFDIQVLKLERISGEHEYGYVKKTRKTVNDYDWDKIRAYYANLKLSLTPSQAWKKTVKDLGIVQYVNIEAWKKGIVSL